MAGNPGGAPPPSGPVNYALTATWTDNRHVTGAEASLWIANGQRHTNNAWNGGGSGYNGWDTGGGGSPAIATADMGSVRNFTHLRNYTLADTLNYNTDPDGDDTFTLYGQSGYDIEISNNASDWTNVVNVSGNNLVRKDHNGTWSARYLRILSKANGTPDNPGGYNARIIEFEIWSVNPDA